MCAGKAIQTEIARNVPVEEHVHFKVFQAALTTPPLLVLGTPTVDTSHIGLPDGPQQHTSLALELRRTQKAAHRDPYNKRPRGQRKRKRSESRSSTSGDSPPMASSVASDTTTTPPRSVKPKIVHHGLRLEAAPHPHKRDILCDFQQFFGDTPSESYTQDQTRFLELHGFLSPGYPVLPPPRPRPNVAHATLLGHVSGGRGARRILLAPAVRGANDALNAAGSGRSRDTQHLARPRRNIEHSSFPAIQPKRSSLYGPYPDFGADHRGRGRGPTQRGDGTPTPKHGSARAKANDLSSQRPLAALSQPIAPSPQAAPSIYFSDPSVALVAQDRSHQRRYHYASGVSNTHGGGDHPQTRSSPEVTRLLPQANTVTITPSHWHPLFRELVFSCDDNPMIWMDDEGHPLSEREVAILLRPAWAYEDLQSSDLGDISEAGISPFTPTTPGSSHSDGAGLTFAPSQPDRAAFPAQSRVMEDYREWLPSLDDGAAGLSLVDIERHDGLAATHVSGELRAGQQPCSSPALFENSPDPRWQTLIPTTGLRDLPYVPQHVAYPVPSRMEASALRFGSSGARRAARAARGHVAALSRSSGSVAGDSMPLSRSAVEQTGCREGIVPSLPAPGRRPPNYSKANSAHLDELEYIGTPGVAAPTLQANVGMGGFAPIQRSPRLMQTTDFNSQQDFEQADLAVATSHMQSPGSLSEKSHAMMVFTDYPSSSLADTRYGQTALNGVAQARRSTYSSLQGAVTPSLFF